MMVKNVFDTPSRFYFYLKKILKKFYQNSSLYNNKIFPTKDLIFQYKPSPHLLASIVKYQKKKYKIEDFSIETIWERNLKYK
jgi:hypothetical protein